MTTLLCARALALTLLAPAATLLPSTSSPQSRAFSPVEVSELQARVDPSLGSLRAGRVDAPAPFAADERAELRAAQQDNASLVALRAGSEPTDHEWKWLAIGAGIVLLIVLL